MRVSWDRFTGVPVAVKKLRLKPDKVEEEKEDAVKESGGN